MKKKIMKNKINTMGQQTNKKKICILLSGLLLFMFLMQMIIPVAGAQLTEEQGDSIIHELEEIAHELEHVEENIRTLTLVLVGVFVALIGQLVVQYMNLKKKN